MKNPPRLSTSIIAALLAPRDETSLDPSEVKMTFWWGRLLNHLKSGNISRPWPESLTLIGRFFRSVAQT